MNRAYLFHHAHMLVRVYMATFHIINEIFRGFEVSIGASKEEPVPEQ